MDLACYTHSGVYAVRADNLGFAEARLQIVCSHGIKCGGFIDCSVELHLKKGVCLIL